MSTHKGWIAVDLDGTLAKYNGWQGHGAIGEPVPLMLERVKAWIKEGREVRIFTARVAPASLAMNSIKLMEVTNPIDAWCIKHLGKPLRITHEKDFGMAELWDDRCKQVVPNTGVSVEDQCTELKSFIEHDAGIRCSCNFNEGHEPHCRIVKAHNLIS